MESAFPNRRIDKGDPGYKDWFSYVFVLQPPLQGATAREFVEYARELKSSIEHLALSENDSIPSSSFGPQGLTLESLKNVVIDIVSRNPIDWVRGCNGISIMHHPGKRGKLLSVLSALPDSVHHRRKLLSVQYVDETFVFQVNLYENNFVDADGLHLWLDNPSDPAAAHLVANDEGETLTFSEQFQSKAKMEYFAMISLCEELLTRTDLTQSDLKCRHEPLGNDTFPDFEFVVRGQEWAVEVTRIEAGMVGYFRLSHPPDMDTVDKVADRRLTSKGVVAALTKASEDKTKRRNDCAYYSHACLVLVDVVDWIDADDSATWAGIDLSAFDIVVLVKLDGSVFFIKGSHDFEPASQSGGG
ncbi:MAG: hypothetical protein OXH19_05285 [Chloroflexi bacterium]|nr:hypothetical protein [Chloroflexota bacterium]MCY3587968.1 hypothetical protein [Chloroflexota bacterium]MCY3684822.1 hypothetical protein [Chloroflexota bacterium]MDE2708652.1 hypothetical protein [Chloroflexota bacterium]